MLELRDAYKVLGLREEADKSEIEKAYAFLIKKYKNIINNEDDDARLKAQKELDEVNDAYNSIARKKIQDMEVKQQTPPNPVFKKLGIDQKKAGNFVYYYKFHFIIGFVALLLAGHFIYSVVTRVEPDLNIVFIGEFYPQDSNILKEKIKKDLPSVTEPSVDIISLLPEQEGSVNPQQEYAMQMKAMAVTAAGEVDVYIFDRANFEKIAKGSGLESLDRLSQELDTDSQKFISLKPEDGDAEHIYGIDVRGSTFLKEVQLDGKEAIAAIRVNPLHPSAAEEFIKKLVN
ncbi:hypothetical protein DFR58_11495 [Anaerobacterium chartisolvens]|uniref:J domain-containing protein n=1 Tax=Anaerobacterium chartisolvens TaxID=1297424 RepID=A0A369B0C9_9FIRM|nr:hypothetical protein [Anaerobacterium chartisolvens]RCX14861.1 hypothetical protein DFR58_11495 [Anaerobacterium chartisolvens]